MYEIDKRDLKIVNLLLEDRRKSALEIARQFLPGRGCVHGRCG
jgi:DNA-binding Lrp family transcriptional regulator